MKQIIFEEVAKLFENLEDGTKLTSITLDECFVIYKFTIICLNSMKGIATIQTTNVGIPLFTSDYLQKEYEILKENGYVK